MTLPIQEDNAVSDKDMGALSGSREPSPDGLGHVEFDYADRQETDEREDEADLYCEAKQNEVRCALALFRSLKRHGEYRAVKADGPLNWTITKPRTAEALLAALNTIESAPPLVAAQPLIARLNSWETFWKNRYGWSPPDAKRIEVRVGDLRQLRTAIAMEARQGRDGETRLDPKDDSAGPMSDVVLQRVARAICFTEGNQGCNCQGECRSDPMPPDDIFMRFARAALEAAQWGGVIEGLEKIAKHDVGLQGLIEDGEDTPENVAKYYASQVTYRRRIARTLLSTLSERSSSKDISDGA